MRICTTGDVEATEPQMVPNRPTPEGYELGAEVARMADAAEAKMKEQFPNARERCKSCAFRKGTVPNGCEATLLDALKCVAEFEVFYCHEKPHGAEAETPCAGWFAALASLGAEAKPVAAPWQFSHVPGEPPDEAQVAEIIAERTP